MGIFSSGPKPLSDDDRAALAKLEQVVSDGIKAFSAAGRALQLIRDKQLYREHFETFEDYIAAKWTMTRQHATRLMQAADVVRNLSPTGFTPSTERQARPLADLPAADQVEAWKEAVEASPKDQNGNPQVSTAAVEAAAAKRRTTKKRRASKVQKPLRVRVPGAVVTVTFNRKFSGSPADAIQAAYAKVVGVREQREAA